MNIRIKKNDYVQPTDVRESVVQSICDIMMEYLDRALSITVCVKDAALYIGTRKSDGYRNIHQTKFNEGYSYVRIHSCEMDAAFKAFQDAGYHIYAERDKKTLNTTYRFSKKPVLFGILSKTIEFDMFID